MKKGNLGTGAILAVLGLMAATATQAAVHRVFPGDSIQAFIDGASPGDTILVAPGVYEEGDGTERYGLRITTDDLRLIGTTTGGEDGETKVRLVAHGEQETGVYAAPAFPAGKGGAQTAEPCDYDVQDDSALGRGCRANTLNGFYIRGFTVEGFPKNGIQTRWVDGFEFVGNESAGNGWDNGNGIYPTLSANGMVRDNVSYGSLDTAMWIAGSENVRVIGNTLYDSVIGFEITVSNNVQVIENEIHGNTIGVGLFHPNGAGNPPLPTMANWVVEHNNVHGNNRPNDAPPNSFQAVLPRGVGILASGVSDHVIANNTVEGNEYVGIAVVGWCTGLGILPGPSLDFVDACLDAASKGPPGSANNLVSNNYLADNATLGSPPPNGLLPPSDMVYVQLAEPALELLRVPEVDVDVSGNCFEENWPSFRSFALYLNNYRAPPRPGPLPTDGC